MKALVQEKEKAIALRKSGYSYKEILKQVPVAKSSLSFWLKDLPLTRDEKTLLKKRIDSNISKGRIRAGSALHQNKVDRDKVLFVEAQSFFKQNKDNVLFHTGIALYWAEGAKRNEGFLFTNSDVDMVRTMLSWIEAFTEYSRSELGFRLYIHHPFARDNWEIWWQKQLGVRIEQFKKTVIKPSGLGVKKRPNYKGCIRIEVPRSTGLLTKMKFWTNMLIECHNKQ